MAISGFIPYGVVATLSLQHQTRQVIEPGALDVTGDIYLLLGYDYGQALARTGAGSLVVEASDEGIEWSTRGRLAQTSALRDFRDRFRAGLIDGVVPGFAMAESTERDGIQVVSRGILCEINLVARATGDGSTIEV